jgi:hypothetical protein
MKNTGSTREMENINRGPIFGDFVTILTKGSMQDVTVARLQSTGTYQSIEYSFPSLFNVMYCVRVSPRTVKIFLVQHYREGGRG